MLMHREFNTIYTLTVSLYPIKEAIICNENTNENTLFPFLATRSILSTLYVHHQLLNITSTQDSSHKWFYVLQNKQASK